jgi:hypothetical protein
MTRETAVNLLAARRHLNTAAARALRTGHGALAIRLLDIKVMIPREVIDPARGEAPPQELPEAPGAYLGGTMHTLFDEGIVKEMAKARARLQGIARRTVAGGGEEIVDLSRAIVAAIDALGREMAEAPDSLTGPSAVEEEWAGRTPLPIHVSPEIRNRLPAGRVWFDL